MRTGWRLAGLQTREAEDALFRLTGGPVVIQFFIRAGCHAHAPGAALILVHQYHAIVCPCIDRPRRAGCRTGWIQAVIANTRQVVENHPFKFVQLLPYRFIHPVHAGIVAGINPRSAQVVLQPCSTTYIQHPCGLSTSFCRQSSRCGSQCIYPDGRAYSYGLLRSLCLLESRSGESHLHRGLEFRLINAPDEDESIPVYSCGPPEEKTGILSSSSGALISLNS